MGWRDLILKEFAPQVSRLTLAADPDGLLLEEGVLQEIRKRGFELIPFEDHVEFRFAYESKFRSRWDRGEQTDLVVVLRSPSGDLRSLPFDLLQVGRKLSFNLGDLFPGLSYPVVASLDRSDFAVLYEAQNKHSPGMLGDNATKDFILRHVFEIAPELIKNPSDLLRVLLRRHNRGRNVPSILDKRLISILRQNDLFKDWPLELIVPKRESFLAFLQERWSSYLDYLAAAESHQMGDKKPRFNLEFNGPVDLPFDHDDVRPYIDTLFIEGYLKPVSHERSDLLRHKWAVVGVRVDPQSDRLRRIEGLIKTLDESLPTATSRHDEWQKFAYPWAELVVLWVDDSTPLPPEMEKQLQDLRMRIDISFLTWVQDRFAGLHNQPPLPPVMVHHIPRALARVQPQDRKVALIVVDGLSIDQWIIIREVLEEKQPQLRFLESAVFAWIPTITSVSRQAVFAGKAPLYFPLSIQTTEKETSLWTQFWVEQGASLQEIAYLKGLGDGSLSPIGGILSDPRIRIVGLVVDKVDRIMHGMELGTTGMYNQIRQWVLQGYLRELIELLLKEGFHVYLTADHGNIEAKGWGKPSEGAIADLRGERVRIFPDTVLRSRVKGLFPQAIEWTPWGLPEDFLPLIAPDRLAFIRQDETTVCHGGISIEELIVPFIKIETRTE